MSAIQLRVYVSFSTGPLAEPAWENISPWVQEYSKTVGRSHALDDMEAGRATLVLDNRDRRFDPSNVDSPYYPGVKSMRQIKVEVVFNGITYPRFRGYVDDWPQEFTVGDQWTPLHCTDGFKLLNKARLTLPFTPYTDRTMTTDEIVGWVLDHLQDVSWPLADRNLIAGAFTAFLSADVDASPLQILQDMAHVEFGAVFMSAAGAVTFIPHNALFDEPYLSPEAVYGNTDADGELPYKNVTLLNDEQHLYNQTLIAPTGIGAASEVGSDTNPDQQVVSDLKDQASIDDYMTSKLSLSLPLISLGNADSLGYALLTEYKQERLYISELANDWTGDEDVMTQLLARDLMDRVTVNHQPALGGGSLIAGDYHIERVDEHWVAEDDAADGIWEATWGLMPSRLSGVIDPDTAPPIDSVLYLRETLTLSEAFAQSLS